MGYHNGHVLFFGTSVVSFVLMIPVCCMCTARVVFAVEFGKCTKSVKCLIQAPVWLLDLRNSL